VSCPNFVENKVDEDCGRLDDGFIRGDGSLDTLVRNLY